MGLLPENYAARIAWFQSRTAIWTTNATAISRVLSTARDGGGLFVVNWHNESFGHPEFPHYEQAFESLLAQLAATGAWVATGDEITRWWNARAGICVRLATEPDCLQLEAVEDMEHLVLRIEGGEIQSVEGATARLNERSIEFPKIRGGRTVRIHVNATENAERIYPD